MKRGDLLTGTKLGTTPVSKDANAVLLALSRAGRSFQLYDAHNEAIRGFLQDYRDSWKGFAQTHGDLELVVRPFELICAEEVVYLERDRERSLAFKMFRDGVRKVTLKKGVTWDELLRLLEILSIRFTGIRQQEDDIVTLLWKADFEHIDIEAVEGVIPDEEDEEGDEDEEEYDHGAPDDRDRPLPRSPGLQSAYFDYVEEEALEALRAEAHGKQLPVNAIRLSGLLLEVVADPLDPMELKDVRFYLEELRDFLMAEEQLGRLVAYTYSVQVALCDEEAALASFHAGFGRAGLRRIIRSIQKNHKTVPSELFELLELVPGDHLKELIALLKIQRDAVGRRMVRQLIERYVPDNESWFFSQILTVDSDVGRDLLRALGTAAPETMETIARDLYTHRDPILLDELLWQLEKLDRGAKVDRVLVDMLTGGPSESVRVRTAEVLAGRGYQPAFDRIVACVEKPGLGGLSSEAAEAYGVVLSTLNPNQAREYFRRWIRPAGLRTMMKGAGKGPTAWAALSGLERLMDPIDDDVVEFMIKRGDKELVTRARACLVRRRHLRGDV